VIDSVARLLCRHDAFFFSGSARCLLFRLPLTHHHIIITHQSSHSRLCLIACMSQQPLAGRAIPTTTKKESKMVQKTMGKLRIRLNRARNLKVSVEKCGTCEPIVVGRVRLLRRRLCVCGGSVVGVPLGWTELYINTYKYRGPNALLLAPPVDLTAALSLSPHDPTTRAPRSWA
jgi:hypothetical protein